MNNIQLSAWLRDRGCSAELTKSIIASTDKIKDQYAELSMIGGSLSHEDWIEEITTTYSGTHFDEVAWFLLSVVAGWEAFMESQED